MTYIKSIADVSGVSPASLNCVEKKSKDNQKAKPASVGRAIPAACVAGFCRVPCGYLAPLQNVCHVRYAFFKSFETVATQNNVPGPTERFRVVTVGSGRVS